MYRNDEFLSDTAGTAVGIILYFFNGSGVFCLQNYVLSVISSKKKQSSAGVLPFGGSAHIGGRYISMNHILAVCDAEEAYASKLADYLNLKEGFPFQVRYFSTIGKLLQFSSQQDVEAALVCEKYEEELVKTKVIPSVITLSEKNNREGQQLKAVWKYQSCEILIKEILQILAREGKEGSHILRNVPLKIIGLYSPVKRTMQTTFGLTMGQLLAKRGKVLYINMEGFSGLNIMLKRNFQRDLSDLLYYMQNGRQGLAYIMGSMVESVNGMDILPPMLCQMDLISIESKEWLKLFYEIENHSEYEYLILDLSDSIQGLFEILRQCSVIYTMTERDGFAMAKIDQYEKMIKQCRYEDILDKTHKCELPKFSYLPEQLDRLTVSELASVVKEKIKEDLYAVG